MACASHMKYVSKEPTEMLSMERVAKARPWSCFIRPSKISRPAPYDAHLSARDEAMARHGEVSITPLRRFVRNEDDNLDRKSPPDE